MNQTIKIILTEEQSRIIHAAGEGAFQIIGRGSWPESVGRYVLHLAPVDWQTAIDASEVLLGRMKAVKIRPPKQIETPP